MCGSRNKFAMPFIVHCLETLYQKEQDKPTEIIEGCCKDSPDIVADGWAETSGIKVDHNPAVQGSYLVRNIRMINKATHVIAFWDEYSYGTCFVIGHSLLKDKKITIFTLKMQKEYLEEKEKKAGGQDGEK